MKQAQTLKKRVFKRCNASEFILNFIRKAEKIKGAKYYDHI